MTGLIFLQLVIGAHLRHVPATATPAGFQVAVFFHLLLAGLITTYAALLLWRVLGTEDPRLARPALGLGLGVLAQLVLGGATWVLKYSWPAFILRDSPLVAGWTNTAGSAAQSLIVTGHVALGSLLLGLAVQLTLRAWRLTAPAGVPRPAATGTVLGGVG